jgi:hypothetical protein
MGFAWLPDAILPIRLNAIIVQMRAGPALKTDAYRWWIPHLFSDVLIPFITSVSND